MGSHWYLSDQSRPEGRFRWLDLRLAPYPVRSLALHNPDQESLCFRISERFLDECWRLHGAPAASVGERQLLALLVNHRALVEGPYGSRMFGPRGYQPHDGADRYGVGTTSPRLWILGEQLNRRASEFPLPFGTTAGRALLWPHVDPYRVRVSNVLEPDEEPELLRSTARLKRDWELLGRPLILAVGRVAGLEVGSLASHVLGYLEHPQHTWRFHHHLCDEWSAQLAKFLDQADATYAREAE